MTPEEVEALAGAEFISRLREAQRIRTPWPEEVVEMLSTVSTIGGEDIIPDDEEG